MAGSRSIVRAAILAASVLALHACADHSDPLALDEASRRSLSTAFGALQDIPAVTMDLPPAPRPWDTDDAALVAALEQEEGHAVIAFKLPASPRALQAEGRRGFLPAEAFQEGLRLLERNGAEILYVYRSFGAASVRIAPALGPVLRRHPLVDYIEPRQWGELDGTPAEAVAMHAMHAQASSQVTPWGVSMVRAPEAWSVTAGGGVKILFIDTGISPHLDLPTLSTANCGGLHDGCADGPSYHGTHVAGIALARNNTIGVVGVAHGIAGNHVYSWGACSPSTGACSSEQVAAGIDAGKFAGVRVINMSLSFTSSNLAIANAAASAWATGSIVLVASAGNRVDWQSGGYAVYPAALSQVIGVSGVRPDKSFASTSPCSHVFGGQRASNFGSHVELAAPFWALSTVGINTYEDETWGWCGNSMATPHVSGAAALVWAQNPAWPNWQVRERLLLTAEDRGASGYDIYFGYGIVDAAHAVGIPPSPPLSVQIQGPTSITQSDDYSWTAQPSGGNGSYTYEWYRRIEFQTPTCRYETDWSLVASGPDPTYSRFVNVWEYDFRLLVVVHSAGQTASREIKVYVGDGSQICPMTTEAPAR